MGQTITGATSAQAVQYSTEYIKGYERGDSVLRSTVATEHQSIGNQTQFVIESSGNATAVTRGLDGNIVPRAMDNNTVTLTMTEWADMPRMTRFNIWSHQASAQQRMAMYKSSYDVISRTVDDQILDVLKTATTGPTNTASTDAFTLLTSAMTNLGNNNVKTNDGNVYACVSNGFINELLKKPEFSSADYTSMRKWDDGVTSGEKMYEWNGVKIFSHTGISGLATSAEYCFLYHKDSVGHALDSQNFNVAMGYNDEQDYSYVRCSAFTGAALLQNAGVQVMKFDGTTATSTTVT